LSSEKRDLINLVGVAHRRIDIVTSAESTQYALDNAWESAQRRLRGIETTYDPVTRRRLTALGLRPGWACLEVGAGSGSVARWLGEQVAPGGSVVAVDLDLRLLTDMPESVQVRRLDVRVDPLPEAAFDLIHTRLVLNHLPEREHVLDRLVAALRPGGWLLLEEGDAFATGGVDEEEDHARAMRAWIDELAKVADIDLGRRVPRMLHERGLGEIGVECELPFAEGGTAGAEWLQLTFDQLNEHAGGCLLDAATISRWKQMLAQPGRWFASLALVATRGRRVR
jgi:SAM-dependent methyltransferase